MDASVYDTSHFCPQLHPTEQTAHCAVEETKIVMEEEKTLVAKLEVGTDCISQDASTQTQKPKLRRRGGRESRTRRLLAFQAMLTAKRGLPMSRLLSKQKTDARSSDMNFLRL